MTVSSTTAPPPYEHSSRLNSSAAKHGFFGRRGGASTGIFDSLNTGFGSNDDKALVGENRRRCANVFGLPQDALLTCRQVHSSVCVVTRSKWDDQSPPTADAMVTDTKGIAIAVLTADCMPVQFLDERAGIIGAAHAGWKGALAGILENTVKAMAELGSKAGDIRACIGPCLRPPNFEIGDDLYAAFVSKHPQSAGFFSPMNEQGKRQFDLVAFGRWRLSELGVDAVDLVGGCTLADPEKYFSYRWARKHAQENYGRNLSAIALV